MAGARPVIAAEIDDLLASHKLLTAPDRDTRAISRQHDVIAETRTPREVSLTVKLQGPLLEPGWEMHDLGLEDIVLAYLGRQRFDRERSLEVVEGIR
jgi:ABC-2 type transport system ATP-binding protein